MKKNKLMRLASVLLVAVLLTTSVISGTFAKYVSSANATDIARVAKWDIKLNGASITSNTFTFDLFDTVNDSNGTDTETDIKDVSDTIIAPGTSGSFEIELKNDSEVTAQYAIDYTVTNAAGIPVQFSVDGTNWTNDIADVTASDTTKLAIDAGATTVKVQWRWTFNNGTAGDAVDTALGLGGTANIIVAAEVTVTQVD